MTGWRRLSGSGVMTLVALVVAHNMTFLMAYGAGYGEALAHAGHGGAWSSAVLVVLSAGLGLLGLSVWRLYRLGLMARTLRPGDEAGRRPALRTFGRSLLTLWLRLALVTALLLVLQENLEHRLAGEVLPGITVLGSSQYPNALLVVIAVALAVAVVGALFRWRHDILVAWIASRSRRRPLRRLAAGDASARDRRPESIVGRGLAVRAPPSLPAT